MPDLPGWINGIVEVDPISALSAEIGTTFAERSTEQRARRTLHLLMFADGCVIALAGARLLMG